MTSIFAFAAHSGRLLLNEQDHAKCKQAWDDRHIEYASHLNMQRIEEERGEKRPEKGAGIVAEAFEPEGSSSVLLVR